MIPNQISPVHDLQRLSINDNGDGDDNSDVASTSSSSSSSIPRSLVVLYSTETGNAQDVAERLGREAERWRWDVEVISAEDFELVGAHPSITTHLTLQSVHTPHSPAHPLRRIYDWQWRAQRHVPPSLEGALE